MIGAPKQPPLLGDGLHHGFERGAVVLAAERIGPDVVNDEREAAADAAEVLEPFFPQEPLAV